MPTNHVQPESAEQLQAIADALWKAKKVLVVTGAGISTNSGIPDFRSKNGLYSLIQAQFEAAASHPDGDSECSEDDQGNGPNAHDEPPSKRRKTRRECGTIDAYDEADTIDDTTTPSAVPNPADPMESVRTEGSFATPHAHRSIVVELPCSRPQNPSTPMREAGAGLSDRPSCNPRGMSSLPPSSSPLSSPPPILFDPEETFTSDDLAASSRSSNSTQGSCALSESEFSDTESDADDNGTSCSSVRPVLLSQSSFSSSGSSSRTGGLPAMKGRELFDASIWADPVKTSVFYTFATTLRQKTRDVVPTRSHRFLSLLRDAGKLVRCYTQNIDEIEEKVGLSTSLMLGPGRKGRFSTRATPRSSSASGPTHVRDASIQRQPEGCLPAHENTQCTQGSQVVQVSQNPQLQDSQSPEDLQESQDTSRFKTPSATNDPKVRGVECVFLHGSLRLLRCFRCGQTTPWDEDGREDETLSGRQPSCPQCEGATAAREGRGKRALAVGKLRPDIVLYGEEHPNAHLISPIVQHDISLAPDMLLILGTSLKVHGLKVLVREFSKAVHSRGGKVVFVNFTKPPESVWSEIIDYWVQWDCDAWVQDLQEKKPVLWLPPGSVVVEPKKKRKSFVEKELREKKREERLAMKKERREQEKKEKKERKAQEAGERKARKEKEKRERKEERQERQEKEKNVKKLSKVALKQEAGTTTQCGGRPSQEPSNSSGLTGPETGPETGMERRVNAIHCNNENLAPETKEALVAHLPAAVAGRLVSSIAPPSHQNLPSDYSIVSAVKAQTRQRRPKRIFEGGGLTGQAAVGTPAAQAMHMVGAKRQLNKGSRVLLGSLERQSLSQAPPEATSNVQKTGWTGATLLVDRLATELTEAKALPLRQPQQDPPPPPRPLLPSIRELFPDLGRRKLPASPFFFQDMLGQQYGFPPPYPQDWSCSDQLQREADERARSQSGKQQRSR